MNESHNLVSECTIQNYRHYILLAVGAMNDLMELKMSFPMYHFMEPLL